MSDEPKRIHTREEVARVAIAVANSLGKCAIDCSECTTVSQCNRCVDTIPPMRILCLSCIKPFRWQTLVLCCYVGGWGGTLLLGHSQVWQSPDRWRPWSRARASEHEYLQHKSPRTCGNPDTGQTTLVLVPRDQPVASNSTQDAWAADKIFLWCWIF